MLATVNNLIANKKIPVLDPVQMSALLQYVFKLTEVPLRIQIAETVYRHNHDHANAFDLFLASTLPLAQRAAQRKASRIFIYPSDWQIELMYDGAVTAMITVFQRNFPLRPGPEAFRRYLLRALALGTVRSYFMRQENDHVRPVGNVTVAPDCKKPVRNTVEQEIINHELLNKVTHFPHLPAPVCATLQCIAALGPDAALKDHAYTASGDSDKWKRARGGRPILDPEAIAKALGIAKQEVHHNLRQARIILREVFNADGKLFLTH
jgi:hypothetical protein